VWFVEGSQGIGVARIEGCLDSLVDITRFHAALSFRVVTTAK
jgi:hypothetical protein